MRTELYSGHLKARYMGLKNIILYYKGSDIGVKHSEILIGIP
jgi:hypothetical protein